MIPDIQKNHNVHKDQPVKTKRSRQALGLLKLFAARRDISAAEKAVNETELYMTIMEARDEWLDASMRFEHAQELELIDYYTYKMKACELRYNYFIKKAKEKGLKCVLSKEQETLLNPVGSNSLN